MSVGANGMSVNLSGLQPATARSQKMTPFCAMNSTGAAMWSACAAEDVWDEMERRYGTEVAAGNDDAELKQGILVMLQLMSVSAAQGASAIVRNDGINLDMPDPPSDGCPGARIKESQEGGEHGQGDSQFLLRAQDDRCAARPRAAASWFYLAKEYQNVGPAQDGI